MDRRQRKTREAIFRAFTELLTRESYARITIAEIIEAADVGRTTFYAHFETKDDLLRALAFANLVALLQKRCIGSLSAYCGATSAATGAACGIAFMLGESFETISGLITNCINTIGGMVCDGAKSSCAAKIAAAVGTALTSLSMARQGRVFLPGEGLVKDDIEATIEAVGRMGRDGMKGTDVEILKIMLGK